MIIGSVLAILNWAIILAFVGSIPEFAAVPGLQGLLQVCGAIGIVLAIPMVVGGVFAIQRKMWGFALVGSILGLFTIGFVFLSSIFAFIALILIAMSRNEFA